MSAVFRRTVPGTISRCIDANLFPYNSSQTTFDVLGPNKLKAFIQVLYNRLRASRMVSSTGWLGTLPQDIHAQAFIRQDVYGSYFNNPLPFSTKVRLWLIGLTIVPLKLLACISCIISYYAVVVLGNAVLFEPYKTKYMAFWGRFWTRALLYCIGFWSVKWLYVSPDGGVSSKPSTTGRDRRFGCYVSNHCSWVDILLFMSRLFPSFVAKKEVSDLPLIGPISKAMQCLFVDREARLLAAGKDVEGNGQGMSQLVRDRMLRKYKNESPELPMLLFPEGTTTNNRFVMPFKRGAFLAGVPVQPLVLRYDITGRFPPTWDSMPGHLHIFLIMTELAYRVTCYVLPLYEPSEEEKADPALYAENVRMMIIKYGKVPPCDETYADKLAFFKYINELLKQQRTSGGSKPEAVVVNHDRKPLTNDADGDVKVSRKVEVQAAAVTLEDVRRRKVTEGRIDQ